MRALRAAPALVARTPAALDARVNTSGDAGYDAQNRAARAVTPSRTSGTGSGTTRRPS